MRYFQYTQPHEINDIEVVIMSEDEIRETYWPYWQEQMTKKFGDSWREKYNFEDCLEDFLIVHWATEVTEEE